MSEQYISIAKNISEKIRSGKYDSDYPLPKRVELASEYGVTRATLDRAIDVLVKKGMLESRKRAGTFIKNSSAVYKIAFVGSYTNFGKYTTSFTHEYYHIDVQSFAGRSLLPEIRKYDGVLWMAPNRRDLPFLDKVKKVVPLIIINRKLDEYNYVSHDHYSAVRDITEKRLQEHDGAVPVYLQSGKAENSIAVEARRNGFVDACRELGMFYEDLVFSRDFNKNISVLKQKLAGYSSKSLVIVSDSQSNTGCVMAWCKESSRELGKDTFYCDFDNEYHRHVWGVDVTSFLQDLQGMVTVASEEIIKVIENKGHVVHTLIPPKLRKGDT